MDERLTYELDAVCDRCGYTFGEHCAADDGCPRYYAGYRHAGFSRVDRFHNLFAKPLTTP